MYLVFFNAILIIYFLSFCMVKELKEEHKVLMDKWTIINRHVIWCLTCSLGCHVAHYGLIFSVSCQNLKSSISLI